MTTKQKKQGVVIAALLLILYYLFGRKKNSGQSINFAKDTIGPPKPSIELIKTPPLIGGGGSFGGGGSSGGWSPAPPVSAMPTKVNPAVMLPSILPSNDRMGLGGYTPTISPITEKKSAVVIAPSVNFGLQKPSTIITPLSRSTFRNAAMF